MVGVGVVEQGFINSTPPHDTMSEAVIVHYDANQIDLAVLIEAHLRTHASTSNHSMREKYRSAVYTFDHAQAVATMGVLNKLAPDFENNLITQVLPFESFAASEARFQRYYETDPDRPFCQRYIDPKLAMLRQRFAAYST